MHCTFNSLRTVLSAGAGGHFAVSADCSRERTHFMLYHGDAAIVLCICSLNLKYRSFWLKGAAYSLPLEKQKQMVGHQCSHQGGSAGLGTSVLTVVVGCAGTPRVPPLVIPRLSSPWTAASHDGRGRFNVYVSALSGVILVFSSTIRLAAPVQIRWVVLHCVNYMPYIIISFRVAPKMC